MIFAILFEDNAVGAEEIRARHMPAHIAFLERNAAAIRAAGPLRDDNDHAAGGLWLVDASDRDEAERLVREDPFWPTGLRRSVRILSWHQVFADGARV